MKKLKMYSGFVEKQSEGACLIFAYSAREAKRISYPTIEGWFPGIERMDVSVKQIKNAPWLLKEKKVNSPHVIESPKSCDDCYQWGQSEILPKKKLGKIYWLCENCRGENQNESHS